MYHFSLILLTLPFLKELFAGPLPSELDVRSDSKPNLSPTNTNDFDDSTQNPISDAEARGDGLALSDLDDLNGLTQASVSSNFNPEDKYVLHVRS